MEGQSREEYIGSLRRKSSGFSRGVSKYRGVASDAGGGGNGVRHGGHRVSGPERRHQLRPQPVHQVAPARRRRRGRSPESSPHAGCSVGAGSPGDRPRRHGVVVPARRPWRRGGGGTADPGKTFARPHADNVGAQPAAAVAQVQGDDRADVGGGDHHHQQHNHLLLVPVAAAGDQGRRRLAAVQLPGGHPDLLRLRRRGRRRRRGIRRRGRPVLRRPRRVRVAGVPLRAGLVTAAPPLPQPSSVSLCLASSPTATAQYSYRPLIKFFNWVDLVHRRMTKKREGTDEQTNGRQARMQDTLIAQASAYRVNDSIIVTS
nr:AP2-like ethylene-responsive transcription factor CRL5 isoform X3 [Oryza sativa Japonica Group]